MKRFLVLLFFTLLALAASISMTHLHYQTAGRGFDNRSFCHVSDFFDCDTALVSEYARIGNFLTAELGIIYYLLVAIGILFALFDEKHRRATLSFLWLSSFFALIYSLVLAVISVRVLGVVCLLCFTTYVANMVLFFGIPGALGRQFWEFPKFVIEYIRSLFQKSDFQPRLGLHLAAAIVITAVGLLFFKGLKPEMHKARAKVSKELYLKDFYSQPVMSFEHEKSPQWGMPDAKVEIVEFSDFQCPFCRRAAFTLKPYLKQYRNNIRLVFMNFPLDSACNEAIQRSMHPVACMAAKGAACAQKDGQFWEYHDRAFENQKRLSRSTLLEIAKNIGLDGASFEQCLASDEAAAAVKADVSQGVAAKVQGTPAVYINGRSFRDWLDPERLRMVLDAEIEGGRPAPETIPTDSTSVTR